MGRTTDKALAKHDEGRKMSYCVGRKMVELCPEVVHDTSEEGMRRQREAPVHVTEQQDTLSLLRRRLRLALRRQSPRLVLDQALLHQLQHVRRRHRGGEEIPLDPTRRQSTLSPLSRSCRLLFLLLRLELPHPPLRHGGGCRSAGEEEKGGAWDAHEVTGEAGRVRVIRRVQRETLTGEV